MRLTLKDKKRLYRLIYQFVVENARILIREISKAIKTSGRTASACLKEAIEKGHIVGPHIRKRSFLNFMEYDYFVHCEDPLELYLQFIEDQRVVYHAIMDGFADLWVVSTEEIDIEGDVLVGGPRSDYYMSFPPDHSWDTAIQTMREKIENFNPKGYEPKRYIENHWNQTVKWDKEDEILYRYFKYNLRKPVKTIMDGKIISGWKVYQWFDRLPETCTILTSYFPETISAYDPYIFVFETDYEDFIIDLFSELPTSCLFFKVSNKLVLYAYIDREFLRKVDSNPNNVAQLHIPLLIRDLSKKGIIKNKAHAVVNYHWRKDI